jgi:hypothetical protein
MDVTNHGSNVSTGETLLRLSCSLSPSLDYVLHWFIPIFHIGLVEGVNRTILWNLYIWLGQDELSNGFVQGENIDSIAEG